VNPYEKIKRSIEAGIAAGQWRTGQVLPSEHELVRRFSVSRMTVNRAMRELANENVIRRVPGVGSFVAEPAAQSALVEIRNIADEIAARGGVHSARVLDLARVRADREVAGAFGLRTGSLLFYSRILHSQDGLPLQLEIRFVRPACAPGYLEQDFCATTPNAFLSVVAPLQKGAHSVRAVMGDDVVRDLLNLRAAEACLLVVRRTWSAGRLVSLTSLFHAGERFGLIGSF
jgi:GntR family histidine utilization transcriptional repressor